MNRMNKIIVKKGLVRWYYNVVSSNGNILSTSQKYYKKGNAVRAAKSAASHSNIKVVTY